MKTRPRPRWQSFPLVFALVCGVAVMLSGCAPPPAMDGGAPTPRPPAGESPSAIPAPAQSTPGPQVRATKAVAATLTVMASARTTYAPADETPRAPQGTSQPSKYNTPTPAAIEPPAAGVIVDFEQLAQWQKRGRPDGELLLSSEHVHQGMKAAKLTYDFSQTRQSPLIFTRKPPLPIAGAPAELDIMVFGDGSGHFLNVWVMDSQGEVRQYTFGPIEHGDVWQPMRARLDAGNPWPDQHVSGPDNGQLDYPISLYALTLYASDDGPARGVIYLDQLTASP